MNQLDFFTTPQVRQSNVDGDNDIAPTAAQKEARKHWKDASVAFENWSVHAESLDTDFGSHDWQSQAVLVGLRRAYAKSTIRQLAAFEGILHESSVGMAAMELPTSFARLWLRELLHMQFVASAAFHIAHAAQAQATTHRMARFYRARMTQWSTAEAKAKHRQEVLSKSLDRVVPAIGSRPIA